MRVLFAGGFLFTLLGFSQDLDCVFFAPRPQPESLTRRTERVTSRMSAAVAGERAATADYAPGTIDAFIFADLRAAGVAPAPRSSDAEFLRRVTLDLTGRIPTADRVLAFLADTTPDKRSKLVEELLGRAEWVDKWTMFFGDLYKNTDNRPSSGLRRFPSGRNAFYSWIRESLAANKPYNRMASELIAAQGANSYEQGELNWLVGGVVGGGPTQDIIDQQTANMAETFLGISHMNCLLCHNGRGHLDALSLWGKSTSRAQAWQLSSFLSHTVATRHVPDTNNRNVYYWSLEDTVPRDYTLGTTTGNRPARAPLPGCAAGRPCYVAPAYLFTGETPAPGENYRVALARMVTADPQFARAAVNYIWAQFFNRGIVDPPNQFDPARLDPDNPPPDPWTLQPSNARLLNTLARRFVDNKYDLKSLMREIANSDAYQLSSRYDGQWDPSYEKLFARHFVRRLWAEEIHDAIVQSSNVLPSYRVTGFSDLGFGNVVWAMQLPDTVGMPGGTVTAFLDNLLRGNRDDADRKPEGSALQALNLMNDPLVIARVSTNQLIDATKSNRDWVDAIFLGILSRFPTPEEKDQALIAFTSGERIRVAQNLIWALYNKVDFLFNY